MRWRLYFRLCLFVLAVASLVYFIWQYINPSGELVVDYDFCRTETPYFSGLSPHGRVLELDKGDCGQKMVIDPVYFDVRLPQSYRWAEINVAAQLPEGQLLEIGVGIDPDNWQWEFARRGQFGDYVLDLAPAKFENNRYRFIISAPGLDVSGREIAFHGLQIKFTKEALDSGNFWQRWQSFFKLR